MSAVPPRLPLSALGPSVVEIVLHYIPMEAWIGGLDSSFVENPLLERITFMNDKIKCKVVDAAEYAMMSDRADWLEHIMRRGVKYGYPDVYKIYVIAAKHSSVMMEIAYARGGKDSGALEAAAAAGNTDTMRTAHAHGSFTDINVAICAAARNGHMEAMVAAKAMGATDFTRALHEAAEGGHVPAMVQARQWGGRTSLRLMHAATRSGNVEAMKLAVEWKCGAGANELVTAAAHGHQDALDYLLNDCRLRLELEEVVDRALAEAACGNHIAMMERLKDLGATDFDGALNVLDFNGALHLHGNLRHTEARNLLASWIAAR